MAKKYYDNAMYAGMDARRAMERQDAGMLPSKRGIAMMPQGVVIREYPKQMYTAPENLNDTMRGIDAQVRDDMKEKKRKSYPEKY